ncbi:MAG: hypothetical protein LBG58_06610 [Planctomycetaceae bacterium]|jgi:hypothetical protein|nr:hypothetical protein [Planctomycetaceae bacterium]
MSDDLVLLNKGIKCLTEELGLLESERFIYILLSRQFDYTEWRKTNLCPNESIEEISEAAAKYCEKNP